MLVQSRQQLSWSQPSFQFHRRQGFSSFFHPIVTLLSSLALVIFFLNCQYKAHCPFFSFCLISELLQRVSHSRRLPLPTNSLSISCWLLFLALCSLHRDSCFTTIWTHLLFQLFLVCVLFNRLLFVCLTQVHALLPERADLRVLNWAESFMA